jgi:hypothetical protein
MTDPDPFDEIVQHLDLDWSVPEAVEPKRAPVPPPVPEAVADPEDEPFYRQIAPRDPVPHRQPVLLAWIGIFGGPATIMVASVAQFVLPRALLLALGLVFVASAVYLFSQLPERGPGEPNWPDDGAQI